MHFHSADRRLPRVLDRIRDTYPENYRTIEDFVEDLLAEGISAHRIYSYAIWLRKALDVVNKRLEEWEKRDVRRVINHYTLECREGKITENSLREVKKTMKKFFKWLGKDEIVNWFSLGSVSTKVSPQDLITEEEFQMMIDACMNSRDRALISLLYESGARVGEIGSMRIRDVSFDDYGGVVWLPKSKTVRRKIRIVYSVSYLSAWLSDHPLKDNPDAPLWIKLAGRNRLKAMAHHDIWTQIRKVAKRAGIKKKVYPHLFRHTRATKLLSRVPESIGAKYLGWVPGSSMVKVYVHLASEDVDEAILKLHGIRTNGSKNDLEVRQCPRCSFTNPASSRFCSRCGLPLTEEAIQEVEEWEKRKSEALSQMTKPDFIKIFMSIQREIEMLKMEIEKLRNGDGVK